MTTIIAAFIGLLAVIAAAALTVKSTRKIESRKQTGGLAAEALVDVLQAFSENSEAITVLRGSSADPLLEGLSEAEKSGFIKQLADSRVRMIAAKARLITFGSPRVAEAAHAALRKDLAGTDPDMQRGVCELIQRIREDLYPGQARIPDRNIIEMLFGEDASA